MKHQWQHKALELEISFSNRRKLAFINYVGSVYKKLLKHFIFQYNKYGIIPEKGKYNDYRFSFDDYYFNARYFEAVYIAARQELITKIQQKIRTCALKVLWKLSNVKYKYNFNDYLLWKMLKDYGVTRNNLEEKAKELNIKCSKKVKYRNKDSFQVALTSKFKVQIQFSSLKEFNTVIKLPVPIEFKHKYHVTSKKSQFLYLVTDRNEKFFNRLKYYKSIGYGWNNAVYLKYKNGKYYVGLILRKKVENPDYTKHTLKKYKHEELLEAKAFTIENKKSIGIDINKKPLIVTDLGTSFHSEEIDRLINELERLDYENGKKKRKTSKRRKKLAIALKNEYNHVINEFIKWLKVNNIQVVILENILGVKIGTKKRKKRRNKAFRRKNKYWLQGHLVKMLIEKLKENDIKVIIVNPRYTSQRCPACGVIHSDNRFNTEKFKCVACGYEGRSHVVSAINVHLLALRQRGAPSSLSRSDGRSSSVVSAIETQWMDI